MKLEQLGKMHGLYTPSPSPKTQQGKRINEAKVRWKDDLLMVSRVEASLLLSLLSLLARLRWVL